MAKTPQEYLEAFNKLRQQTGRSPLKPIPTEVFLGLARSYTYDEIALRVNRKEVTVRGIAVDFWTMLSEVFNTKITKHNFLQHLDQHAAAFCMSVASETVSQPAQALLEIIPNPERFYGRTKEIFDLRQQLERPGITLISGATGIGKTALVGSTLSSLPDIQVVWQTIHESSSLSEIWQAIAPDAEIPDSNLLVPELMRRLTEHRYVIVLDQSENLLNTEQSSSLAMSAYTKVHQPYSQFFKEVCEKSNQASVIILSQQVFPDLQRHHNLGRAVVIRYLTGLNNSDALFLLESHGLGNRADWSMLVDAYNGNPRLMLQALPMLEYYDWNIRQFLDHSLFLDSDSIQSLHRLISRLGKLEKQIIQLLRGDRFLLFPQIFDALSQHDRELTRNDLFQAIEGLINSAILEKMGTPPKLGLSATVETLLSNLAIEDLEREVA
jgi:hypothetical protein